MTKIGPRLCPNWCLGCQNCRFQSLMTWHADGRCRKSRQAVNGTYKFLHNKYVKGHRLLWAGAHRGKKQWRVPRANQYPCVGATNACMASDTFLRQRWHMRVQVFIYMSIPFKADSNDQTPTNWRWWGVSIRLRATIIVSRRQPHTYCRPMYTFGWQCIVNMYQT